MSFSTRSWGVCLGLLLCSAWAAAQDDVIGYVKTVTGGEHFENLVPGTTPVNTTVTDIIRSTVTTDDPL